MVAVTRSSDGSCLERGQVESVESAPARDLEMRGRGFFVERALEEQKAAEKARLVQGSSPRRPPDLSEGASEAKYLRPLSTKLPRAPGKREACASSGAAPAPRPTRRRCWSVHWLLRTGGGVGLGLSYRGGLTVGALEAGALSQAPSDCSTACSFEGSAPPPFAALVLPKGSGSSTTSCPFSFPPRFPLSPSVVRLPARLSRLATTTHVLRSFFLRTHLSLPPLPFSRPPRRPRVLAAGLRPLFSSESPAASARRFWSYPAHPRPGRARPSGSLGSRPPAPRVVSLLSCALPPNPTPWLLTRAGTTCLSHATATRGPSPISASRPSPRTICTT